MKKYNIFSLYVVTINGQKFICESIVPRKEYREILTERKIELKPGDKIEKMINYYPLLEFNNPIPPKPLFLTKENILDEYITINNKKEDIEYYQEQTDLSSIIDDIIEKPDVFYKMVGEQLTPEERQYIESLLSKSCDTCSNMCCRVEQVDKPIYDCIGWENNRIVGQYKVLKLNKKILDTL